MAGASEFMASVWLAEIQLAAAWQAVILAGWVAILIVALFGRNLGVASCH